MKKSFLIGAAVFLTSFGTASADKIIFDVTSYAAFKQLSNQLAGATPGFVWYQLCQPSPTGGSIRAFQAWTVNGFHVAGKTIMIVHFLGQGATLGVQPPSFTADFPEAVSIDCTASAGGSANPLATIN